MSNLKVSLENIIPLTEARDHFSQIVAEVQKDRLYVLTKGGKPAVAIIDVKYLESITGGVVNTVHIESEIQKDPGKVGRTPMYKHDTSHPNSKPIDSPKPFEPATSDHPNPVPTSFSPKPVDNPPTQNKPLPPIPPKPMDSQPAPSPTPQPSDMGGATISVSSDHPGEPKDKPLVTPPVDDMPNTPYSIPATPAPATPLAPGSPSISVNAAPDMDEPDANDKRIPQEDKVGPAQYSADSAVGDMDI